jgi:hypothetical protein
MSGFDWEDDEDELGEEESTDMGEESPRVQSVANSAQPTHVHRNRSSGDNRSNAGKGQTRRVRLKPMPASMQAKWPDVVSLVMTLNSGKQIVFVKG